MLIRKITLIAYGEWDGRGRQEAVRKGYDVGEGDGEHAYEPGSSCVTHVMESKERETPGHFEGFCLGCLLCGWLCM